ncbi:hypothetical protein G3I60_38005 [Streptomyces sp. SID13666]|uniref:hypothetical protein n=1 Tax=unclassified Streptomyces TaxID=2593676 RepID=UPI0013C084E9|nr:MULTISPECIES: hypothetical protein [unclassified Streptomyces]NEA59797.1 hypothetical protein [Streptomyces sp. SID13666]NEA76788.1 hypothetical protein [Streptomyces sp. SID13588]
MPPPTSAQPPCPARHTSSTHVPPTAPPTTRPPGSPYCPGEATATGQAKDKPESSTATQENEPLHSPEEAKGFRSRWQAIQGDFIDDPQDAVRTADALVAEVMQTLAWSYSSHKQGLEGQWCRGEQVETEDLHVARQRYRSFFNRLLST